MKRYEISLFSDKELASAIVKFKTDEIIDALARFTVLCESGREDFELSSYTVWLYDVQNCRNICFYTYDDDETFGCYEELTPCKY